VLGHHGEIARLLIVGALLHHTKDTANKGPHEEGAAEELAATGVVGQWGGWQTMSWELSNDDEATVCCVGCRHIQCCTMKTSPLLHHRRSLNLVKSQSEDTSFCLEERTRCPSIQRQPQVRCLGLRRSKGSPSCPLLSPRHRCFHPPTEIPRTTTGPGRVSLLERFTRELGSKTNT